MFIVGKILSFAFLPPGSFALLFALGFLCSLARKSEGAKKWSRAFIALGAIGSIACSIGPLSDLLLLPLENARPALARIGTLERKGFEGYSAIVVLGSGTTGFSPEEGRGSALGPYSARRVSYAYRLARRLELPLLFSGGKAFEAEAQEGEAQAARRFLIESGMDGRRIMVEDKSVSTWENAAFTAKALKEAGLPLKVVLVTSAFHMPRALLSFRKNGIEALAAPTDYLADRGPPRWIDWLPSPAGIPKANAALHEYLGWLWYSLKPSAAP